MCTLFKTSICCPNKPKAQIKYEMVIDTLIFPALFSSSDLILSKNAGKFKLPKSKSVGKFKFPKGQKVRENSNSYSYIICTLVDEKFEKCEMA